ncbi:MAG: LLM class F420-dependent oxidoreductase [Acidimicrobiales bacterium]
MAKGSEMRLGFAAPCSGSWATPGNQVEIAHRAEELGYDTLWVYQRLLYAVEPLNDYPSTPGQPWPDPFRSTVDPLVTLAYLAGHTEKIRLGTALLNAPFYTPAMAAKMLATLDRVSAGRLTAAFGLGWSMDEFAAMGVPYARRGARTEEFVRCLRAIWAEDEVSFDGEFYKLHRVSVDPKPVQRPAPPILIGGYGDAAPRRAVTIGDGYLGGNVPLADVAPLIARISEEAERAGRDPAELQVVSRGSVMLQDSPQGDERRPLHGSLDEVRADVERYREAGLTELFVELNFDPRVASPDADPARAMGTAMKLMEALAPGR